MRGVPLKAVQELLGHASIEMTMRYAHLSPDVQRDAVRLLGRPRHKRGTWSRGGWKPMRKHREKLVEAPGIEP